MHRAITPQPLTVIMVPSALSCCHGDDDVRLCITTEHLFTTHALSLFLAAAADGGRAGGCGRESGIIASRVAQWRVSRLAIIVRRQDVSATVVVVVALPATFPRVTALAE